MPFTFLAVFVLPDFLVVAGCLMTLALPGVGSLVQYHLPFAKAQDKPSLAVPYRPLAEILFPNGSSSFACPLVLLRLRPVADE
jgi:hypothetical protein